MTPEQFQELRDCKHSPILIDPDQWTKNGPRTLLYGYTCDRHTFHVYTDEKGVHVLVYASYPMHVIEFKSTQHGLPAADCVPDKRVYIDVSDYAFCKHLKEAGLNLSFTPGGSADPKCAPFLRDTYKQATAKAAA